MNQPTVACPEHFAPGSLVRVRNREWVVQPNDDSETLRLRPLGGSDEDIQIILPGLEHSPVVSATFPPPDSSKPGSYSSALLLRDALRLKLRSSAGPFRSFGHIAVEPRAYQLVPLLMALKMPTVRLLIADDVGIGKTIEAALIVRELLDRGEIRRFAVLCPPHLVDQWQEELHTHFHLRAAALTASSVSRLERDVPAGESIFNHFPAVVVSLDYIKSESHRDYFISSAPECIVVDEAHTCTMAGRGRQLRFALLERLARDSERHLIMLTATPHSGDDAAFGNLLSLLKPDFATLAGMLSDTSNPLRAELALHFVQRRRKDIDEWQDTSIFPRRLVRDAPYRLTGEWGRFFEETREYCLGLAQKAEEEKGEAARMMWYATLALLRCISSSPAAAVRALSTRLQGTQNELLELAEEDRIDDGDAEELEINDQDPAARIEESALVEDLLQKARGLHGMENDPKLARLLQELDGLLKDEFRPVIFCRYIATATYVADELSTRLPFCKIDCVTGILTSEERAEKVASLSLEKKPVLVATDCLSEGINLQDGFTAVIHYDLAWNPTRHEQREGRVDRFGQKKPEVRCLMLYGEDNPVDGFVFNVIIRKAESIKKELGVLVPMPDDDRRMRLAVVKAALMKQRPYNYTQGNLDFYGDTATQQVIADVQAKWNDALEKAKANRTAFAQRRLKPADVLPEWHKQMTALGTARDVERFTLEALTRLLARPDSETPQTWRFSPATLPPAVRERLAREGMAPQTISFCYPCDPGARFIHRSHPLVSVLADHLLESALSGKTATAARSGCFETASVSEVTSLYLLRIRYQIRTETKAGLSELMAEESIACAVRSRTSPRLLAYEDVESLLDRHPEANLDRSVIIREVDKSIDWYSRNADIFANEARTRAEALRDDHTRVRTASSISRGKTTVSPCLPPDLIGVYVLLPAGDL